MKTKKIYFAMLCALMLYVMSNCVMDSSEPINLNVNGSIQYPETGKYGVNILAEECLEVKSKTEGSTKYIPYSLNAEVPAGKSLKIVLKAAKSWYVCKNCWEKLYNELHEICPNCGGKNTFEKTNNPHMGFYQGSDINWVVSNADEKFTCTVYKSGISADATFTLYTDFIIEYYENGATTPTIIKEIKVKE